MSRPLHFTILTVLSALCWSERGYPQPPTDATVATSADATKATGLAVVARVNGAKILLAECHRYLNRLPFINDDNRDQHTAWALQALIERQIVLDYLRTRTDLLKPGEVEAALETRRQLLATRGQLLETACADAGINEDVLARGTAWNLIWPRYLAKQLTHDRLKEYFQKNAAHFDGRQLQVAQILWEHDAKADQQQRDAMLQEARRVLEQIRAGSVSFAEAARKYSHGPSAANGGELGWIERDGPMTERFSRAAFELRSGQISQPVTDQFGVHLIYCQAIKPGRRDFFDVRFEVERAARRELFEALAKRARQSAVIEYTGIVAPFARQQDLPLVDGDAAVDTAEELNE